MGFDDIVQAYRNYGERMCEWPEEDLRLYLTYHWNRGTLVSVRHVDEQLLGVGIARLLTRKHLSFQRTDYFGVYKKGDMIYVDSMIVAVSDAVPVVWNLFKQRWGTRQWVGARRHEKVRVWPMEKMDRIISKLQPL